MCRHSLFPSPPLFSSFSPSLPPCLPLSLFYSSSHLPSSLPVPLPPSLTFSPPPARCRQHLEKKHRRRPAPVILHQNQRLNNQSDTSKTPHDLKDGGVRVQEIAPETTSHPIHLHNGSASSGFVEEMEHYAQTSFNGELFISHMTFSLESCDIDTTVT